MRGVLDRRSPRELSYSPALVYPSKFHQRPSSHYSHTRSSDAVYRHPRHHYPTPAYNLPRPSLEREAWGPARQHVPSIQPTSRKADLSKHHSEPTTFRPMFRQFQYPAKVPSIPAKIHHAQSQRGRINTTINDTEMRPSYASHQTSRILTPQSISSDSEEELLLRAEEENSDSISEPPSLSDSHSRDSEEHGYDSEAVPPYQAVEEQHYQSFSSSGRPESVMSTKSVEVQVEHTKKKKKKEKQRKFSPASTLTPLREEEEKPKLPHKAKAPPVFPAHQSPQFIPQPIIYQMPQPFPMPFPVYPPTPQYIYPPYYPQQYAPPPVTVPEQRPTVPLPTYKRARATQYAQASSATEKKPETPAPKAPSFVDIIPDINFRMTPAPDSADVKYRRPVALEIGIGESKSLAEHFQEKLPEVNAKLTTRESERPRREHKDRSNEELLEIRKELLRRASPRTSLGEERKESPWRGDAVQREKADRLAAGSSSVAKEERRTERRTREREEKPHRQPRAPTEIPASSAAKEVKKEEKAAASKPAPLKTETQKPTPKSASKPAAEIKKPEAAASTRPVVDLSAETKSTPKAGSARPVVDLSAAAKPALKPEAAAPKPETAASKPAPAATLSAPKTGPAQIGKPGTDNVKAAEKASVALPAKEGPVTSKAGGKFGLVVTKPETETTPKPEPVPVIMGKEQASGFTAHAVKAESQSAQTKLDLPGAKALLVPGIGSNTPGSTKSVASPRSVGESTPKPGALIMPGIGSNTPSTMERGNAFTLPPKFEPEALRTSPTQGTMIIPGTGKAFPIPQAGFDKSSVLKRGTTIPAFERQGTQGSDSTVSRPNTEPSDVIIPFTGKTGSLERAKTGVVGTPKSTEKPSTFRPAVVEETKEENKPSRPVKMQ